MHVSKTPQVGFEPTTNRLTADRSTPELLRIRFYLLMIPINCNFCPELKTSFLEGLILRLKINPFKAFKFTT